MQANAYCVSVSYGRKVHIHHKVTVRIYIRTENDLPSREIYELPQLTYEHSGECRGVKIHQSQLAL